ncbi:hypothetical protein EFW17_01390 [Halostreptopolyspora alba]|uniref:Winged helix DNA-binding domain-containing protein n=1 Tax=Halostreptopolyspora alba TaxID=2487137 RepID=A0A3N0EHY4_9ACTN|nr:hypothetical protein EFW17_01390 [Nocardiopsaceae bacterium YIM 96095]
METPCVWVVTRCGPSGRRGTPRTGAARCRGVVPLDGWVVGAWNVGEQGERLNVSVSAFESLGARDREAIEREARSVASLREADRAEVIFD